MGYAALSDDELALCFELPVYLIWDDRFLRDIVPLQMFRSVIDAVTESMHPAPRPPPFKHLNTSAAFNGEMSDSPDVSWLEGIEQWMPGSYGDASIADKAVKSDDAPVGFCPWHC